MKNNMLNRIFSSLLMASGLLLAAASCEKKEQEPPVVLSISLVEKSVSSDRGSQAVQITAPGEWTVTLESDTNTDWLRFSPKEGKGSTNDAMLTWQENEATAERSCTIILSNDRTSTRAVFTQAGHVVTLKSDPVASWMELPAVKDGDGLYFVTHPFEDKGTKYRNYSLYFDPKAKVAQWIAYPLNSGLRGSGTRNDAWGTEDAPNLDPKVPREYQAVLHHAFKPSGYDRGHQIPSADRYRGNSNEMTFYGTNMTPQMSSFNQGIWADLEGLVRNWASSMDTLYVVTGANLKGVTKYATDNDGKEIAIPSGYYKVLLGYKKAGTIGETKNNDGYTSIAFYFDHKGYTDTRENIMKQALTVKEIEEKLGMDFFVNLPEKIGKDKAAAVENLTDKWFWNN